MLSKKIFNKNSWKKVKLERFTRRYWIFENANEKQIMDRIKKENGENSQSNSNQANYYQNSSSMKVFSDKEIEFYSNSNEPDISQNIVGEKIFLKDETKQKNQNRNKPIMGNYQ